MALEIALPPSAILIGIDSTILRNTTFFIVGFCAESAHEPLPVGETG